jgi:hypothetical protein
VVLKGRTFVTCAATAGGALALALGACGDDDEETTTAAEETTAGSEITVTADEYSFELSEEPQAGPATFALDNVGEEDHVLILAKLAADATLEDALEAEGEEGTTESMEFLEAPAGEEAPETISTELTPGNYAMVCPVETKDGEPHFELGQQEEFEITE